MYLPWYNPPVAPCGGNGMIYGTGDVNYTSGVFCKTNTGEYAKYCMRVWMPINWELGLAPKNS